MNKNEGAEATEASFKLRSCFIAISLFVLLGYNYLLLLKISNLEQRLDNLESLNKLTNNQSSYKKALYLIDELDKNKSSGDVTLTRVRRSDTRRGRRRHYGCHLVGRRPLSENRFSDLGHFVWSDQNERSSCMMRIGYEKDPQSQVTGIKSILITQDGHYLVYAQVTLSGDGDRVMGFQVMRIRSRTRGSKTETSLMKSLLKQERAPPNVHVYEKDSGYQSGYFYLKSGDSIEVRPVGTTSQFFDHREDSTYFGAVYMR